MYLTALTLKEQLLYNFRQESVWGIYFSVSTVAALSFRPDCDTGTVIAPSQKIRAYVIEPNKEYYQKVVISSFHSNDSQWDQWRTHLCHLSKAICVCFIFINSYTVTRKARNKNVSIICYTACPSNTSHHF